ncbi:MAG TPA: hypothetical protein PKE63_09365 [Lacibacter sp.]|nr:hypothetical protein [Lacibacter sp.]HMO88359.1 hypothetical protein [Lacibacter sp.]HMP87473.1 hypothetical protein [Lacibacter sp.]
MPQQPPASNRKMYKAYKMEKHGNIDFQYWHHRTPEERMAAAAVMTEVAYRVSDFLKGKVDRSVYKSRKHPY